MTRIDSYYGVIEAGRFLNIHPETVKRLCRQGDLPATKLRNTWLISKKDLAKFASSYNPKHGPRKKKVED